MADKSHETLKWIMRAGYAARGVIYVLVGVLAFWAAFSSGQAEGTQDTLAQLRAQPMGVAMLWLIGAGLFAYMIWRIIAGVVDVEDEGSDAAGLVARLGQVTTGLIHGVIGFSVIALASGGGSAGDSKTKVTQAVLDMPGGQFMVGAGALILAGAGVYYAWKGWTSEYQTHLAASSLLRRIDPILRIGLIIYGLLLVLVAVSFGYAALYSEASQSGGLGQALQSLRGVVFGRFLLAFAGLGLMAFALYNFAEAKWRIVPRLDGTDVPTLRGALSTSG